MSRFGTWRPNPADGPFDETYWKSAIQKGVRRGDIDLIDLAGGWLLQHGKKDWLIWRFPVLVAEDSWNVLAARGDLAWATLRSRDPALMLDFLRRTSVASKNPDAAHLSSIAQWAQTDTDLMPICLEVVPDRAHELEAMAEALARAQGTEEGEVWRELMEQASTPSALGAVSLARYRGLAKGGMEDDKWLMLAAALLVVLRPEPQVKEAGLTVRDPEDGWPPWFCADMHTTVGKKALMQVARQEGMLGRELQRIWFLYESRRYQPNGLDPGSVFEDVGFGAAFRQDGRTVDAAHALWKVLRPRLRQRVKELLWPPLLEGLKL